MVLHETKTKKNYINYFMVNVKRQVNILNIQQLNETTKEQKSKTNQLFVERINENSNISFYFGYILNFFFVLAGCTSVGEKHSNPSE